MAQMRSAVAGIPLANAMITNFHAIGPEEPLQNAVALTLSTAQKDFPVIDNGRLIGVLTQAELFRALAEDGQSARVAEVMDRDFETADSLEMLEPVLARLQACECPMIPVLRAGMLVGIVTRDNIGEFLTIRAAVDSGRP